MNDNHLDNFINNLLYIIKFKMKTEVILAIIGLCLYSLSFIICITMIILISIRIRPLKSNISVLLTCNTYFNALLVSSIMLLMYSYNLQGNLDSSSIL
jgi:hypothetical protein